MKEEHFNRYLSSRFRLENCLRGSNEILDGILYPLDGTEPVPVRNSIPRFVNDQGYAGNFGLQWNAFRSTQLDSWTGLPLTFNRFWNTTKWKPKDLYGKTVLEVGSGAGRFTEVLLEAGASVVSFDLTNAVDANWKNNRDKGDLFLFQGDLFHMPFSDEYFDYVFCFGVLQHTPDPNSAYRSIFKKLKPGGRISIDYYRRFKWPNIWATPKYLWRPVTRRMNPNRLLAVIQAYIPLWLPIDSIIRRIPYFGPRLLALVPIPCWNYLHLGLTREQRREWAIMDTFDALAACYDYPKTIDEVQDMIVSAENAESEVFYGSNGVVANVRKADRENLGSQ
jgi:SAM-dependent methyltransferase